MVRARKARGQKEKNPARMIGLEFDRADLTVFVANMRACFDKSTDPDLRHFLGTAGAKFVAALKQPGDTVRCEAKADSWRRLALESLAFNGGRIGQSLMRLVYLADQRQELAREKREQAENDAELKRAADRLRREEAEKPIQQGGAECVGEEMASGCSSNGS